MLQDEVVLAFYKKTLNYTQHCKLKMPVYFFFFNVMFLRTYTIIDHYRFLFFTWKLLWLIRKCSGMVSHCLFHEFELIIDFSWLTLKATLLKGEEMNWYLSQGLSSTDLARIWNRFSDSIFCTDTCYTTHTLFSYVRVFICLCMSVNLKQCHISCRGYALIHICIGRAMHLDTTGIKGP